MSNNRRDFLKTAGLAAAGLSLPFVGKSNFLHTLGETKKLSAFGLQLWTVKEDMIKDAKGTLAKLSSYGYKQIESFEGPKGFFWGWKNTEFKKYMDDLGMSLVSSHSNNTVDFERKAAEAARLMISNALMTSLIRVVKFVRKTESVLLTTIMIILSKY